ncbi:MAG: HAMP domain-containing protein [Anaerolineae bacterium]|nr:HAMP domain-containing protein [Anaerolineae bacterium]
MGFSFWHESGGFALEFPLELPNIALSIVYIGLFIWALWLRSADFRKMDGKAWTFLGLCLILLFPTRSLLVLYYLQTGALPASPISVLPATPTLSLVGLFLVALVTIKLGPGPGLIINLVAALTWAWFGPLTFTDVMAIATWGLTAGYLLHQTYKGELYDILRRPLIALPVATLLPLGFLSISRLITNLPPGGLLAIDYMIAVWNNEWPLWLVGAISLAILFQLLFLNPSWRAFQRADTVSLYSKSIRARLIILIIPLVLLSVILSVVAVTSRAINLAREQSLDEMRRSAENAVNSLTYFHYSGQNLIATFAEDPALLSPDPQQRMAALATARQVVPFFQELLLVDQDLKITEAVPSETRTQGLTSEEELALNRASSLIPFSSITRMSQLPSGQYGITLVRQVFRNGDNIDQPPEGFLLGRVQLDMNPEMRRALEALQAAGGSGAGFILDENGFIIAHPNSDYVLRPWSLNKDVLQYPDNLKRGTAYEDVSVDGYRVLIYTLNVEGTPYRVVLQLPFSTVLETAAKISSPLLFVQIVMGALLLIAIPFFSTRIIQPLNTLAEAADHIAGGNLTVPVAISGEDEVAQLGSAFEQMRVRLQARLNDLSLLLNIAQSVSATLDLERGVHPILEGALEETGASVARFVMLGGGERPQRAFVVGGNGAASQSNTYAELDRAFAAVLTRRRDPLVIQDLEQLKGTMAAAVNLQSVAIFPVRPQNSTVAVLWVGDDKKDAFDEARVNFLSTLASQAAVLVENARLFQAAEGGRRRLAAILASTTDAILVTDAEGRLLLTNPAAQNLLALDESALGRPLSGLALPEALTQALTPPKDEQQLPTVEVPIDDRRTYYASIAPITGTEGTTLGMVAVMRDVTHFKELDEMKSEFVATVSHDLRAPLTFIRGYATMLVMVGDLNEKQHDYLERILEGIDQMSALIGDLLNLRRIEAGVGIRQEPCRLGLILVEAVDTMRARATSKGVTLRLEPTEGAPTVTGDRTLLRQAVSNLVDNAIKYTPAPGQVSVGLETTPHEAVIHISDTGIGIAPEDQVRLFEKFYRIKRRETGNIQGTGLGLALVKSIIERHGGRVWAESVPNQGSSFYIALPLPEET